MEEEEEEERKGLSLTDLHGAFPHEDHVGLEVFLLAVVCDHESPLANDHRLHGVRGLR